MEVAGDALFSGCVRRIVPLNIRLWFLGVQVLGGVVKKVDGVKADLLRDPREGPVPSALCSSIRALESLLTSRCSQLMWAACAKISSEGAGPRIFLLSFSKTCCRSRDTGGKCIGVFGQAENVSFFWHLAQGDCLSATSFSFLFYSTNIY